MAVPLRVNHKPSSVNTRSPFAQANLSASLSKQYLISHADRLAKGLNKGPGSSISASTKLLVSK